MLMTACRQIIDAIRSEHSPEAVAALADHLPGDECDAEVERCGEQGAEDAQLFADDGEDEVGRVFRQVTELLNAVAQPAPEEPPVEKERRLWIM
jgi:hypothetical protein